MNNELQKKYGLPTATACCVFFCVCAGAVPQKQCFLYNAGRTFRAGGLGICTGAPCSAACNLF